MHFNFSTAARIIFGPGSIMEAPQLIGALGQRAFLVTGRTIDRAQALLENLTKAGIKTKTYSVSGEPTIADVMAGVQRAREVKSDIVIGIGGGSAIDTGKAIAALITNEGEPLDYLEVIGHGKKITKESAPYVAIPTTSGTGAEVTANAVLFSPENKVKVSLRSPLMLPKVAIIDPELTYSLPPTLTASTGMDALTQLIEPYVSNEANPLTDIICDKGMRLAAESLILAYKENTNLEARNNMAMASLFGGLALQNAKLGAVHGFAGPIGGMFPAPHGSICAKLLPLVMAANIQSLEENDPDSPILTRYAEIAQILTGNTKATALDGVKWVQELCETLVIPSLSGFGMKVEHISSILAQSKNSSSMKGNPIILGNMPLIKILEQAII